MLRGIKLTGQQIHYYCEIGAIHIKDNDEVAYTYNNSTRFFLFFLQ